jgi:ABC-type antimicrobial peptide transport system permease subunit
MQVLALVLRQGLTLAGMGIAAGVFAAFALTRLMQSLLYEVQPTDAVTFGVVVLALTAVALLASALPAWRATRVSPLIALRTE